MYSRRLSREETLRVCRMLSSKSAIWSWLKSTTQTPSREIPASFRWFNKHTKNLRQENKGTHSRKKTYLKCTRERNRHRKNKQKRMQSRHTLMRSWENSLKLGKRAALHNTTKKATTSSSKVATTGKIRKLLIRETRLVTQVVNKDQMRDPLHSQIVEGRSETANTTNLWWHVRNR